MPVSMRRRPWSCLALALLLLLQLGNAVAVTLPRSPTASHGGLAVEHCARHAATGTPGAGPESPAAPGCCHHSAGSCHCAQMAALPLQLLAFGDVPPPDASPVQPGARPVAARPADFFRPPI